MHEHQKDPIDSTPDDQHNNHPRRDRFIIFIGIIQTALTMYQINRDPIRVCQYLFNQWVHRDKNSGSLSETDDQIEVSRRQ